MVEFFDSLSLIGFLGVAIWASFPITVFAKKEWFFTYDERILPLRIEDQYITLPEYKIGYMAFRFIVIGLAVYVSGKILTLL